MTKSKRWSSTSITTDGEKPKISLGIKQLNPDPWNIIPDKYKVGSIVPAKVQKVLDFGAFVELDKGVEGLVHVSEISDDRVERPAHGAQARSGSQRRGHLARPQERTRSVCRRSGGQLRSGCSRRHRATGGSGELGAKLGDVLKKKAIAAPCKQDENLKRTRNSPHRRPPRLTARPEFQPAKHAPSRPSFLNQSI